MLDRDVESLLDLIANRAEEIRYAAEKYIPKEDWQRDIAQHHSIPQMSKRIERAVSTLKELLADS